MTVLHNQPKTNKKILLIEDNPGDARLVQELLKDIDGVSNELVWMDSLSKGIYMLTQDSFFMVFLDINLPDSFGINTYLTLGRHVHNLPVIILSGLNDETIALDAIRNGAQDYLVKDTLTSEILKRTIRYAIERQHAKSELQASEQRFREMIENAVDAVLIVDSDGMIQFMNPAAENLFGQSADEMIGTNFGFPASSGATAELEILKNGAPTIAQMRTNETFWEGKTVNMSVLRDISEQKKILAEREELIAKLEASLAEIKTLSGMLPICSYCKKIRNDKGYWNQLEEYIQENSTAQFSHGICPACAKEHFPDIDLYGNKK